LQNAEEAVKTFANNHSILRIGGIYGLDGPSHLGLNKAINNAIYKKEAPVLYGNGKAKRNYICVKDVARWILNLLQKRINSGEKINDTLYLSGTEVMTIKDYLQAIIDVLLPEKELIVAEGNESHDWVIKISTPPFDLITFKKYLVNCKDITNL